MRVLTCCSKTHTYLQLRAGQLNSAIGTDGLHLFGNMWMLESQMRARPTGTRARDFAPKKPSQVSVCPKRACMARHARCPAAKIRLHLQTVCVCRAVCYCLATIAAVLPPVTPLHAVLDGRGGQADACVFLSLDSRPVGPHQYLRNGSRQLLLAIRGGSGISPSL